MNERLHRWLPALAALFVALQPTGAMTFVKSCLYGATVAVALVVLARSLRGRDAPVAPPPPAVTGALLAWSAWSALTWFWSSDPDYSLRQIDRELMDTGLLVIAFYVAARDVASLRVIVGGAIASLLVLGGAAIALDLVAKGWDPGRWHLGVGPWSTFLVIVAPLLLALLPRPPLGPRRPWSVVLAVAAFGVLLVTARMSDSRMIWIALAATFATAGLASAWQWRHSFALSPARWIVPFAVVIVAMGLLFADAARERAARDLRADATIAEALAEDPRIPLWEHATPAIRERLWTGHGFGRMIVGDRFVRELHNPLLTHLHNLFLSQWAQSGAIGLAAFCALLATMAAYYVGCIRARDERVGLIGTIGLAMLAGFVVRNLTDDFLFRSNAKEFWLLHAALIGCASSLSRERRAVPAPIPHRSQATPIALPSGRDPAVATRETERETR
jgi:O-antigen ligase